MQGSGFRVGSTATGRKYTSLGIPGTGIYRRQYTQSRHSTNVFQAPSQTRMKGMTIFIVACLLIGFIGVFSSPAFGIIFLFIGSLGITAAVAAPKPRFRRAIAATQQLLERQEYHAALDRISPFVKKFSKEPIFLAAVGMANAGLGQGREAEGAFNSLYCVQTRMAQRIFTHRPAPH